MELVKLLLEEPVGVMWITLSICVMMVVASHVLIRIINVVKGIDEEGDEDVEKDS